MTTVRRTVNSGLYFQNDVGFSSDINSPKCSSGAHQTEARNWLPNKANKIVIFDQLDVGKFFVVTIGTRYPEDQSR